MEEDTEFKKLPVDERCTHKLWKARVDGYEEAAKLFREIDDEKSPEWSKFLGLIKKFVIDSNVMAQEKGLEATLIFVENCGHAGKTVGEVISGIVAKCMGSPKAKTKDLAIQIALMYIEIEKHEAVMEELIKGMDQKNPKTVAACIATITLALREFGTKVIAVKPIVKKIAILLSDRDKTVREEAKLLTIEIYRWIGPALKPQLATLAEVLIKELDTEFDKMKGEKAEPTRYLRSQQEKAAVAAAAAAQCDDANNTEDAEEDAVEIDPLDLIDPIDILSKLPKDFYEKLESKKWQERKESLEALETLLQNPKLEPGDYGELVKTLKKVLTKDSNVLLVAMAGKALACLAKGLGKKFSPYAGACIPAVLEKFKEKKTNVVTALREAVDAMYPVTNLEAIQEDVLEALNNKNPSVKSETASFLARAFTKTSPTVLNKKLLKAYMTPLLKTLNESDPVVRDASADAIGTVMKLLGEKAIGPYLTEVDALKMNKVKECFDKAVIVIKIAAPKKERPATAPAKAPTKGGSTEPKPVTRPATAGPRKTIGKKVVGANTGSGLAKSSSTAKVPKSLPTERDLSPEEVDERATDLLPSDVISGLVDSNWKTRLSAVESFMNAINDLDDKNNTSQVLVRMLNKKPGLKDTNFQVLKIRLDIIKLIAEKMPITTTTCDYVMNDITEKLGDAKNSPSAAAALTAIAETINLEYAISKVMSFAFEQKSPKVQQEALIWVNIAIREFGFQVNPKMLLDDAKKSVQSINPAVRGAGITLLGTMYLYMGNSLAIFFDGEKPALKQQIQAEFDKNTDQKAPAAIRGIKKSGSKASLSDDEDDGDNQEPVINVADLLPRIDISPQITDALLAEMSDKNWKTRNEGLIKLQGILNDAKLIKSTIGDLPQALAHRIVDSNAKIAQTAIAICEQLATVMGPACKQHIRVLFPGLLHGLGDMKVFVRNSCITCINNWGDICGYKEFFEGEMIAEALKSGSPVLKIELWGWLGDKLLVIVPKSIPKEELVACLPYLYASICDRSADVRKNANDAVLGIMIHVGFETMVKALDKQKPASKKDIQAALDKARPFLPVKPLPKSKQQAPIVEEIKSIKTGPGKTQKTVAANAKAPAVSSRKKEEEVDTSPLLAVNNTKSQRLIDEQKLRVLKWTFTQPREEFTELLKEQMTTANVNKGLMANMFHEDFRYHLKVIDSLIEDLPNNDKALICNLDLVLKWLSLRFYDTNPSVLLKGLEYLNMVFQMLIENEYMLAENEGGSFIPHLLIKIGDPKDAVRNGVRSLLRQICLVYPYTKVFTYIMDGLKSKNARQRTECLDELGYLIETYGLTVCQPTSQAALKEIARHISDRDNSVRNAALNSVVQAYFLAGDKVYKLIGQLSEKDLSMLDERIKRAKKTRKPVVEIAKATSTVPAQNEHIEVQEVITEEELPPVDEISPVVTSSECPPTRTRNSNEHKPVEVEEKIYNDFKMKHLLDPNGISSPIEKSFEPAPSKPSGPFGLDPNIIAEIEKDWVKVDQIPDREIPKVDLTFMDSPLKIVERDGVGYPIDKLQKLLSNSPSSPGMYNNYTVSPPHPNPVSSSYSIQRSTPPTNLADSLPKLDPNLVRIIRAIGATDSLTARAAINELNDIIDNPDKQAVLRDYEEIYVQSILKQFQNLSQLPLSESLVLYQPLLGSIFSFFNSKNLGKNLSIPYLKNIMSVLLSLMADHKLASGDEGQYTKVINGICLKILDRTNFTNLNCALIRLLKETCSSTGLPKFTDLLMKCIWRNVKVMPERSQELDYDAVLLEVHEFMLALPSAWWHQRPSDTPLRTVKTIIHNMAKIKGNAILQHLNKIPTHSELHAYLIRILKKDTPAANSNGNSNLSSPQRTNQPVVKEQKQRMTKQTHDAISYIFKLIADTQTSKEGLGKLYDFKMKNPDVDVIPFLKGASPTFQKYIEDGLADIERQRALEGNNVNVQNMNNKDADYWLDKLNTLRSQAGLATANVNYDGSSMMDNKTADENLNLNQIPSKVSLIKKDMNSEPISSNRLELLQQKLAQIRQQK